MRIRSEVLLACVFVTGGASGVALASCGGDDEKAGTQAPETSAAKPGATAPAKAEVIRVRVGKDLKGIPVGTIGSAYCRKREKLCAAIKPKDLKRLSPDQRKSVLKARKRVAEKKRRSSQPSTGAAPSQPEPAPSQPAPSQPAPTPQPTPRPEPQPKPDEGQTTTE